MSDIVKRLRNAFPHGHENTDVPTYADDMLMHEAAAEIEHLRRRLNEVDAQLTAEDHIHARENMALRAEKDADNERLHSLLFRLRNYIAGERTLDRPKDAMLELIDAALKPIAPCDDAEFGMMP